MPPIKIWHIGGDDVRFRLPLLLALRRRGFDVGAVGSEEGGGFRPDDVPYWRYSLLRRLSPLADLRSFQQLHRLFVEHRPDVIHAFDTKPTIIAPAAAARAGVPGRVITITGMGYVFSSGSPVALALRPAYRWMRIWAARSTGITVFQNSDDREHFIRSGMVAPGKDRLVRGSGIDIEGTMKARPRPEELAALRREAGLEGRPVVTMIARLVVEKGVREYLEAATVVRKERPDVAFLLVGPAEPESRRAVPMREVRKKAGDVLYLGPRSDVPAILAVSDVLVLPSYYREGVPRVLLEAGAAGLPLIATDMPGCRDVVKDGWNGFLVPPRDTGRLAAAILRMIGASPEQREEMGGRARSHVLESFGLEGVADAYAEIYTSLMAGVAR